MKSYLLLFLILATGVSAQTNSQNSDSALFTSNLKQADLYRETDRKKSFLYNEAAIHLAKKNHKKLDEAVCLDLKGYILNKDNQYGTALQCYLAAFVLAENSQNEGKSWLAGKTRSGTQRLRILANIHQNFAHVMRSTGNNENALFHYRESERLFKMIGDGDKFATTMFMGAVFFDQNKLDSALLYEQKAEHLLNQTEDKKYGCIISKFTGDIYFKQGNKPMAIQYYTKGIRSATEEGNLSGLLNNQVGLARYYVSAKQKDSSLFYAGRVLKGFSLLKGNSAKDIDVGIAYEIMFKAFRLNGEKDSTLKYMQLAILAKDSINNEKVSNLAAFQSLSFKEQLRLQQLEKEKELLQNKLRTNAMLAGLGVVIIIGLLLYRNNRQKQKANRVLGTAFSNLKSTQNQLIQSEKMASLGELIAGIAHEIQNPLNFVNNFSEGSVDLVNELKEEVAASTSLTPEEKTDFESIADLLIANQEKINHHGKRADAIVKGMLQHSRGSSGQKVPTDINALADEFLRISYHGLRAKDKSFNSLMKTDFDSSLPKINLIPQDIGRVILNLVTNAFYAVNERLRQVQPVNNSVTLTSVYPKQEVSKDKRYEPTVTIRTKKLGDKVEIRVSDNGDGIPERILDKIFQPFFTTKPSGQGTGLGLSLSYDIITKGHNGQFSVETKEGQGSTFLIMLPI